MPSASPSHLISAVALALGVMAPACADIVKCQDRDGNVTLTDLACPSGTYLVQVVTRTPPPPTVAPRLVDPPPDARGVTRVTLQPDDFAPPRYTLRSAARPAIPRRSHITPPRLFATDAATLKAARMALILGQPPVKVAGR